MFPHDLYQAPTHQQPDIKYLSSLEESLQNFVLYLINFTTDGVVQDAGNQETLHISCINVQFSRDELDVDSGVGFDKLDYHLKLVT